MQTVAFVLLLVSAAVMFVAAAVIFVRMKRNRRITSMPDENGTSHACEPKSFCPFAVLKTRRMTLSGHDVTLDVFDGVYCSACGRELCCETCGKTPARGTVLSSKAEGERAARCCPKSKWALRYGGARIGLTERARAAAKNERLRWN